MRRGVFAPVGMAVGLTFCIPSSRAEAFKCPHLEVISCLRRKRT